MVELVLARRGYLFACRGYLFACRGYLFACRSLVAPVPVVQMYNAPREEDQSPGQKAKSRSKPLFS